MNIRQLKQFISVAETGSVSRSAKEQHISQPALTRSLKNMEDNFGVDLIERRSNGVFLTECGQHLLSYARSIVNDYQRARVEIAAMKSGERGRLAIGVGPVFSAGVFTAALDRLLATGSRLEISLMEGFVEDLCADLRNGSIDAVLSLFPVGFDSSDLSFAELCRVESVMVASSGHKLAGLADVCTAKLAQCNWVIADQKYASGYLREFLGCAPMPQNVHHVRANSMRLIKNLVLESDYLTILPKILVESELLSGELTIIDGPVKPLVTVGAIATRRSGLRTEALKNFTNIVKEEFGAVV